MRPQPLIAVTDVEASSRWYQRLLGCQADHGGREYDRLLWNGKLVLQLHSFGVGHHHGPIGDPGDKPYGRGVLLWFEVDDFDAVMERAEELGAEIVLPRHRNPPEGNYILTGPIRARLKKAKGRLKKPPRMSLLFDAENIRRCYQHRRIDAPLIGFYH